MLPLVLVAALLPAIHAVPAPAPKTASHLKGRTESSNCTFTDAAAVLKSKAACASITLDNIAVPAGTTLDLTELTTGTKVIFQGTTTFEFEEWEGPLISVSGTNIEVSGATGHVIDGNGALWWDGKGSNGGKTKPKMFYAHDLKQSVITGLNVKNTPVQFMSIHQSTDLSVIGVTMDNSEGTEKGHNTDAFDVGVSENVYISGAVVLNQDDCLAINSGTNITFTGGSCTGGHGLSIGSVGGRDDNDVKSVTITDSKIVDSDNGVRIKTVYDASGSVSDVTYSGITLSGINKYGIVIEQDYENGSPTGTPTTGVPITGLTVSNITGAVGSDGVNVYILCGEGSCSDWTWSGVEVTGGKTSSECLNIPTPGGAAC